MLPTVSLARPASASFAAFTPKRLADHGGTFSWTRRRMSLLHQRGQLTTQVVRQETVLGRQ